MVDYGLGGIAKKLRLIAHDLNNDPGPPELLVIRLSGLLLFVQRMQHALKISDVEKEDLLVYGGVPLKKTQIPESHFLIDEWIFLFHQKEREENLWVIRHWFYGRHSHQMGMFLEYQFNRFTKMKSYQTGKAYRAGVRYYPSAFPVRITEVQDREFTNSPECPIKAFSIHDMLDHHAKAISLNPFLQQFAYALKAVRFAFIHGKWFITDASTQMIPVMNGMAHMKQIIAWSGAGTSQFLGEMEDGSFSIHAVIANGYIIAID